GVAHPTRVRAARAGRAREHSHPRSSVNDALTGRLAGGGPGVERLMRCGMETGRLWMGTRNPQTTERSRRDMADNSTSFHEDPQTLSAETKDRHRAIASIMEELEAVDWYDQRVEAASDPDLAAILAHNRDEEKEHAAMTLEWLRRRDPVLDHELRTYLFTEGPITEVEAEAMGRNGGGEPTGTSPAGDGSLGIGSLRGEELR